MKPYYSDDWLTVYAGDCRAVLAEMESESVHCVVTSPPYWGLRDYGTATWDGGDAECDHLNGPLASPKSTLMGYTGPDVKLATGGMPYKDACGKCGARRIDNQLGLEPTPEQYVENMVAVFREVRRVLRNDGTLWLNLGDSYAAQRGGTAMPAETLAGGVSGKGDAKAHRGRGTLGGRQDEDYSPEWRAQPVAHRNARAYGLKHKDLVGIPWRVAFALQADGWYLRSDIIWSKPNPMPESVTDRPTKSHEYLFLLSKSARYYYDADAVREPNVSPEQAAHNARYAKHYDLAVVEAGQNNSAGIHSRGNASGRNRRSVWNIPTQPYPGAHFAVFPPKLVEPCIKAGCPEKDTVLDPFAGSGTVGMVAQSLSRRAVLIDLNPDYIKQQLERNADLPLGLVG